MALASPPTAIAELRRWLERVEAHGRTEQAVLSFGLNAIDRSLPQGGLPLGHLHEVIEAGAASEYAGLATLFISGIVARLSGPVLWCLRGRDLFAPALARIGLHPDRVIYCETWKDRDVLPAMEEGLRCAGLAAVVGEVTHLHTPKTEPTRQSRGRTAALLVRY
jgi:protein ImuA